MRHPPEKLQSLLQILADPEVQQWIEQQRVASDAPTAAAADDSMLARQIDGIRDHIASIIAAVPKVPAVLQDVVTRLGNEMDSHGTRSVLALVAAFAVLGLGAERIFWLAMAGVRKWIIASPLDSPLERLRAACARLGFGTAWVTAFALGSVGSFLAFDWPPMLRDMLLRLLVVVVMVRMALVSGGLLFAPGAARFRLVPMDNDAARYWHRRLVLNAAWTTIEFALAGWLLNQGVETSVMRVVVYALYLVQLAMVMELVWRRPGERNERHRAVSWLLTLAFVVLLLLRVVGAFPVFAFGALALGLYGTLRLMNAIANQIQRGPDASAGTPFVPSVGGAAVVRALRLGLIMAAGLLLVQNWGIDLAQLITGHGVSIRIVRGAFSVVVIALIADLLWFVFKAMIERKLAEAHAVASDDAQAGRATRLGTVLPILRNVSFVTLAVIAVLTALSALGVDIAPMVAGAGVVGIAVGFGAQTLVKDIVSGIFFLIDDAFRVGEYIQSGNYKGTVESFSLRSVRLRHHRGPVYTVPFGELGAVQNMSRDWVIDKLSVGITYDSNLEKARKLIKAIGQDLAADPEMGPNILEPLKMQGVEQFGDFAIQIRLKMMTRPGEQFVIRRKAYAAIKTAFDANGIRFAFPTVQVAGASEPSVAAAAQQMLSGSQSVNPG